MSNTALAFFLFAAMAITHTVLCIAYNKDIKSRAGNKRRYAHDVIEIAREKGFFGYLLAISYYMTIILAVVAVGVSFIETGCK